jgi:hypothetical protein
MEVLQIISCVHRGDREKAKKSFCTWRASAGAYFFVYKVLWFNGRHDETGFRDGTCVELPEA